MGKFKLSQKSYDKLEGVNEALVSVVERAIQITKVDFCVLEGLRSVTRQAELVKAGKSQTMKSNHLTGRAVDLGAYVDGKISWEPKYYDQIADAMLQAAASLSVSLVWGGSWVTLKDLVHFELGKGFNIYDKNLTIGE